MTTTSTVSSNRNLAERGVSPVPAPVAASAGRLPRRRRWGLVAAGIVLVVVCAVVAYLLVVTAGVTRPYLALDRNVAYGTPIAAADLTVVNINPAAGLHPVPAADRNKVIGQHAAADLFAGTLLTSAQLSSTVIPAPGQQLVGVELKPGQLPARHLKSGDAVILVIVPASSLAGVPDSQAGKTKPQSIPATVADESAPETNGNVRVDVAVSQADGPNVASMAAAGRIAIVVTTRS